MKRNLILLAAVASAVSLPVLAQPAPSSAGGAAQACTGLIETRSEVSALCSIAIASTA